MNKIKNEKETKKIKITVIFITMLLFIFIVIMIISNQYNNGDLLLSNSYDGGYGTYGQSMFINVDIYTNGKIKLTDGNNNLRKKITVDIDKINNLKDLINNSGFLYLDSDLSNYDCDGGQFSYITVYIENSEFKTGGYCISNDIYSRVASEVKNIVGYDVLSNFREKIVKYYDE